MKNLSIVYMAEDRILENRLWLNRAVDMYVNRLKFCIKWFIMGNKYVHFHFHPHTTLTHLFFSRTHLFNNKKLFILIV